MKTRLLSLLVIAMSSTFSFAQGGSTYFGLKGGVSLSSYSGDYWDNTIVTGGAEASNRFSFTGALAVNSHLGDWFLFKHEFWATNKGAKIEDASSGTSVAYSRWYADIAPLQFGVNLKGFQVFAGPQAGLLLFRNDVVTDEFGNETKEDSQEGLSIVDYGFIVGSEFEFPFGLNFGVRYIKGFRGLDEDNDLAWYNSSLLVTAGWTFGKE